MAMKPASFAGPGYSAQKVGSQAQAFPFINAYANQQTQGMTPQQRALANLQAVTGQGGGAMQNPMQLAGQLQNSGYDQTKLLQEGNFWQAQQAARQPLLSNQGSQVRQRLEGNILDDMGGAPTYLQESAKSGEQAAMQQLRDEYARGNVTDLEYRQRQNDIRDATRRNVSQIGQAGRQTAMQQGQQYVNSQAQITQQGVNGLIDVLSQMLRIDDEPSAASQLQPGTYLNGRKLGVVAAGGGGAIGGLRAPARGVVQGNAFGGGGGGGFNPDDWFDRQW